MSTMSSHEPLRGVRGRRPLAVAAWGLLLVGLDLNVNGFDLLPDVVGWVLVVVAAMWLVEVVPAGGPGPTRREAGRRRLAVATAVVAVVAMALSLPWVGVNGLPLVLLAPFVAVALLLRLVVVQATHAGDDASAARWHRRFVLWCAAAGTLVLVGMLPAAPTLTLGGAVPPDVTVAGAGAVVVAVVVVAGVLLLVTGVLAVIGLFRDSWRPWARPLVGAAAPPSASPRSDATAPPAGPSSW